MDYITIRSMKLTNRRLNAALSDPLLWIELCERDKCVLPSREFRKNLADNAQNSEDENIVGQLDFEQIWVKNPFRSNLVPPTLRTLAEMEKEYGWKFSTSGQSIDRSSMKVEEPPAGCEPHPDFERCFSTSYTWGQKLITINLVKEGVPEWILDRIRPRIVVSECVAPRFDCASEYHMHAQLLRENELFDTRARLPRFRVEKKEWPQWTNPAEWERVEIIFDDYPMGMREIGVLSQGKDQQFWAGNYGSKFANLQIRIEMPDEARWLTEADLPDGQKAYADDLAPFISMRPVPLAGRPGGLFNRFKRRFF
ncbi:hypothetical protein PENTCL1PPCAC_25790 [Pristionchus entomophagus]|uniref:FBA domain-containing protein n=1 Tax=Pristionchus entomophagus TaxID=358040 RepID=A0AAV5U9Q8_9BILA|nr:hypothetical protein PENTCL1PPCAC_25790 [Pristionchus entomophagus]